MNLFGNVIKSDLSICKPIETTNQFAADIHYWNYMVEIELLHSVENCIDLFKLLCRSSIDDKIFKLNLGNVKLLL